MRAGFIAALMPFAMLDPAPDGKISQFDMEAE